MASTLARTRLFRHWLVIFIACGTVSAGAWGAGQEAPAPKPAPAKPSQGTLRFRIPADPATLDWTLAHTNAETYVIMNLMEGLLEEGPDLKPRPALAQSWTQSPDGKTYTFKLRKGVRWSDGADLKAQHFVDSWKRLMDPKLKASYAAFLSEVASIGAPDDSTFEVRLKRPVPYFLHIPTFWVTFPVRRDLILRHGNAWSQPPNLVTLGPYRLSRWEKDKTIILDRNPHYWGKRPSVLRAEISVNPNDLETREQFVEGAHDFLLNATTEDFLEMKKKGVKLRQFPYLATYYLGFNTRTGPLRDVNFRRALAHALNLKAFPAALQGGQLPATGWIPPGVEGASSGLVLEHSLYEARAALVRAGYGEGAALPELDLWVAPADRSDAMARVVTDAFKRGLGIDVTVHAGSASRFQSTVKAGKTDLFLTRWGLDYPDPASALELFESSGGTNYTGWKSAEYVAAMGRVRLGSDPKARLDTVREAEEILLKKDVVVAPLFYTKNSVITGRRVKKLNISPLNYLFIKDVELTD
ncbi:MAG: peptide ABC transporter substrate-binding protein [Bdellovibrionales bacterium]|nr:peptide ABC transporter substrate-binding protein [Bdellovibrionales bacterium]